MLDKGRYFSMAPKLKDYRGKCSCNISTLAALAQRTPHSWFPLAEDVRCRIPDEPTSNGTTMPSCDLMQVNVPPGWEMKGSLRGINNTGIARFQWNRSVDAVSQWESDP